MLNGRFINFDLYVFLYVVDLLQCVLLEEIEECVEKESCVFLEVIYEIELFYKVLDISYLM